jgi:protein-S-isoprenylcysteine O-methyltransferase Ste14
VVASLRRSAAVSILFTLFGGPGWVLVYLPYWITRFRVPAGEPWWQTLLSGALILAGTTPLLDSIHRFVHEGHGTLMPGVPTEHLVATGLYRYVRNPMYVGVLTALFGEAILLHSRSMVEYSAMVWLGSELFIRLYEEPTLRRRYGEEYTRYCQQVHRWWPRIPRP